MQPKAEKARLPWYEFDLGAIRHNYRELRRQLAATVKIYACLKRNAYGCGAGPVAMALASEGIDGFCVAVLPEAAAIRAEGINLPILLYPGPLPAAAELIQALNLTVTVSSVTELDRWCQSMDKSRIFVKVDLGFYRAGVTPSNVGELLAVAHTRSDVEIQGIYAHLSEFSGVGADATQQFVRFQKILLDAEAKGHRPPIAMLSSTDSVLSYPEMDLDAVDPGALFFGIVDIDKPVRRINLNPALKSIKTRLVSVKKVDSSLGSPPNLPGYRSGMVVGVLGMGWGDGYPRYVPTNAEALVRGRRVRVLGPSHLEHLRVDLSSVPNAQFGDEVAILGHQEDQIITLECLANQWGTDPLGIYCQLHDHIPHFYME